MSESSDFWDGFEAFANLMNIEVDKILAKCYNDRRTQNDLLDVKSAIKELREANPHGHETMAVSLP